MLALLIIACGEVEKESEPSTEEGNILVDQDGDGYLSDEDCDDGDGVFSRCRRNMRWV